MKSASFSFSLRRRAEERRDWPSSVLVGMEEGRRRLAVAAGVRESADRRENFMVLR